MTTEREKATIVAEVALAKMANDPDSDLAILARQFQRSMQRETFLVGIAESLVEMAREVFDRLDESEPGVSKSKAALTRITSTLKRVYPGNGKRGPIELDVLRAQVELLREVHKLANDSLRSAWQVAERSGRETNWPAFRASLRMSLEASHAAMASLDSTPVHVPTVEKGGR